MKSIKISPLLNLAFQRGMLVFILLVLLGVKSFANVDAVKNNNEAVDHFVEALKQATKDSKPKDSWLGFVTGLLGFGGEKDESKKVVKEKDSQEKENGSVQGDRFTPQPSEQQKKENTIDQELIFKGFKKMIAATLEDNDSSPIRLNLGLGFELSGDLERAEKIYKNLQEQLVHNIKSNSDSLSDTEKKELVKNLFLARYNGARILGAQKKIDEAINMYQKALEIMPTSEQVKVNIEVLLKAQQGKGKGKGDSKDKKDGEEGERQEDPNAPIKETPDNSEYKSQNLSKEDVEKILEELQNQEQKIRDKEYNKSAKEKPNDKDW